MELLGGELVIQSVPGRGNHHHHAVPAGALDSGRRRCVVCMIKPAPQLIPTVTHWGAYRRRSVRDGEVTRLRIRSRTTQTPRRSAMRIAGTRAGMRCAFRNR